MILCRRIWRGDLGLIRRAADRNLPDAQHNLGVAYLFGRGVERDASAACQWFKLSAPQGQPLSQCLLADCYENGNGVERSENLARYWYVRASEAGVGPRQRSTATPESSGRLPDRSANRPCCESSARASADQSFSSPQLLCTNESSQQLRPANRRDADKTPSRR